MDNNILNKRTKGEWKNADIYVGDYTVGFIAVCNAPRPIEENLANAAFICKAVNNYDSLLEALKNCVFVMERARNILSGKDGGNCGMLDTTQAKEAIKKAQ